MTAKKRQEEAAAKDQYYTAPKAVKQCLDLLWPQLAQDPAPLDGLWFVEPSAGAGAFLLPLERAGRSVWGGDIDPKHPRIHRHDFLADPFPAPPPGTTGVVVVGNPPFGRKSKLALAFINKALDHAPWVGFVVPIQLKKWSAQSQVRGDARLLIDQDLPEDSFEFQGKPYLLRCCFQVWTRHDETTVRGINLRLKHKPRIDHPDFTAWQYNRTDQALHTFDKPWDFAMLRQGYGSFKELHGPSARATLDRKKQWIFVQAHSPEALATLKSLDYERLSKKNTGMPGFGKADLVEAYERQKGNQGS